LTPRLVPVPAASPSDPTPPPAALFDVEPFRVLPDRRAVTRRVDHPTLVLGSTQRAGVVRAETAASGGVEVARRHGGGGAVLLHPGDHLWMEAWIPRHDPLWEADVAAASLWVGRWWAAALSRLGIDGCSAHEGPAAPGPHGALVCFSGRGPGEVFRAGRKVMGLSQWRSREGSLFHACAYARWNPAPLIGLLDLAPAEREALGPELAQSAIGLDELGPLGPGLAAWEEQLLTTFPTWEKGRPDRSA
jgi:lipoate---protein ligase